MSHIRLLLICPDTHSPAHLELSGRFATSAAVKVARMAEALEVLEREEQHLVLVDAPIPDWTSEEVLEEVLRICPSAPVIVRDAGMTPARSVRLTRLGASQCFGPETDDADLAEHLEDAMEDVRASLRRQGDVSAQTDPWMSFLVGRSRAIREIETVIRLVAHRRCTVLITGETGTGKEMVARALHMAGPRAHLPLVAINCAALPENLLEAELFGHVKGAFTGAVNHRTGRFEQAHRSTLFLDEIGDMPLDLQAKLLRVLQEREFQRLGSSETVHVDVRVIAASNVNLLERVRQGRFRQDLYYRLNVVPVRVPPLHDRLDDVPVLAQHFIEKICHAEDIPPKRVGPETLERLCSYSWPGNVRELENAVEMAVALSGDRHTLYPSDFPSVLPSRAKVISIAKSPHLPLPDEGFHLESALAEFERGMLMQALERTRGNKTLAADLLGLKRTTFLAKLRSMEVAPVAV